MIKFVARKVTVLKFSYKPDRQEHVMPPECHAVLPETCPVFYDFDTKRVVGKATNLKRIGNRIVADLELWSEGLPAREAFELIQMLTPATAFYIRDAHEFTITYVELTCIGLCSNGNSDPSILPLGDALGYADRNDLT